MVSRTFVAMGTVVGVNLYVEDEQQGEEVQTLIAEKLKELENRYLSYRVEDSEIWKINHSGGECVQVSDFLYEHLQKVWEISEKSGGALDVTVGEVTRLWNIDAHADAPEGFVIPGKEELAAALTNVGYEKLVMEQSLTMPLGMSIDLGAVGKGIACDVIKDILLEKEIPAAVISVGGSNLIWGQKDDGMDWLIGVVHPREEGSYLGYLQVEGDCFIATSGDYERFVLVGDERYHHIMDPETGYPARSGLCSVTIVSDSGLLCDALSTACFVLGKEKGMELAKQCGAEALFVEEDGNFTMTDGMKSLWLKEE
ncbi:MAG: FAD:protein FMN transferase [Lachnospiraceae bacterium]|nr:FAD:protein FMN transferase [Lachnospiraceae bacterium]